MEVLRNRGNSPPLSLPQQDAPVDLTKGTHAKTPLFHPYHFETSVQDAAFPHLRLNGRVSSIVHKSVQGQSYPVITDTNELEGVSHDATISTLHREFTPLPKKRRLLDDGESSFDMHLEKRRKINVPYDVHLEHNRPFTPPNYPKEFYHPSHTRSFIAGEVFERPEELFHVSSPLNYPIPPNYGIENATLMDRIMNPHSIDASTESIKETENLLAAVQHSQMLYYTYCTQILQNLQTRRLLQEQHHLKKCTTVPTKALIQTYSKEEKQRDSDGKENSSRLNKTLSLPEKDLPSDLCTSPTPDYSSTLRVCSTPLSPSSSWSTREAPSSGEPHSLHARKRAPRALTGKHVRPGTGASPSTLLTLRQKLAERLKSKDEEGQLERHIALGVKADRSFRGRKR